MGGLIVAVLTLPKLVKKSFHERGSSREIQKLKEKILESEKRDVSRSETP